MNRENNDPSTIEINKAFEAIYEKYFRLVYYLAYNFTSNHEAAQDITQEVFLKAYMNLNKINQYENIKAGLVKVTTNCYFSLYRKQKNLGDVISLDQQILEIEAPIDSPESQLIIKENRQLRLQYI